MKKFNIFAIFAILLVVGCNNHLTQKDVQLSELTEGDRYVSNILKLHEQYSKNGSRSLDSSENTFNYFNELTIVDKDDNPINFYDLTESEQQIFISIWAETEAENIDDGHLSDEFAKLELNTQNNAYEASFNESRSNTTFSQYLELYKENFLIESKKNEEAARTLASKSTAMNRASRLSNLKKYYKYGRVISGGTSSLVNFAGHVSITTGGEGTPAVRWSDTWDNSHKFSVSAYGNYGSSVESSNRDRFEGAANGVIYEPLGMWLGIGSGAAPSLSYYKVGDYYWKWDWGNTGFKFSEASDSSHRKAAEYAIRQVGKDYNFFVFNKFWTDSFYCSSLVWRSWYQVNTKYDLDFIVTDTWCFPGDVVNSFDTKKLF